MRLKSKLRDLSILEKPKPRLLTNVFLRAAALVAFVISDKFKVNRWLYYRQVVVISHNSEVKYTTLCGHIRHLICRYTFVLCVFR